MRPRHRESWPNGIADIRQRGGGVPALLMYWRGSEGDGRTRERGTKDEVEHMT
jgi:hypothetical protein